MYRKINQTGVSRREYVTLTRRNEEVFMRRNNIKHKEFTFPLMTANVTMEKADACAGTIAPANHCTALKKHRNNDARGRNAFTPTLDLS